MQYCNKRLKLKKSYTNLVSLKGWVANRQARMKNRTRSRGVMENGKYHTHSWSAMPCVQDSGGIVYTHYSVMTELASTTDTRLS